MAGIFKNGVFSMGFDMSPPSAAIFTLPGSAPGGNNGNAASTPTPFNFGYSWQLTDQYVMIGLGTNLVTLIQGIRVIVPSLPSPSQRILAWYDATASAWQCNLQVYADGHFQFASGSSATGIGAASAAGLIKPNTWIYLETKVVIGSGTAGSVELRVNGSTTPAISSSGLATQSSANAWVSGIELNSLVTSGYTYYDDWYMLDTTAAAPLNTYLGNVQVRGDKPSANSAVAGRNAFAPSNPQNVNYLNVGNIPYNSAQYNASQTPGQYDMFKFPVLSSATTVFFLNEWVEANVDGTGSRTIGLDCYSGTTDAVSPNITPSTTITLYNQPFTVDPSTNAAWNIAAAGAAELGVKVVA